MSALHKYYIMMIVKCQLGGQQLCLTAISPNAVSPNAVSPNVVSPNAISPNTITTNNSLITAFNYNNNYDYVSRTIIIRL